MDKAIIKKLLLGVLVTGGTILFIVGIFFIGRKQSLYTSTFHINVFFKDINGLREGDFVRYSGANSGIVENISFINDSTIKVRLKIEKKMQPFIKKDVLAIIGTEGLVGNKMLNLRARHNSRETIEENGTIESINPFNTQDIIEKLLSTNDNAEIITKNLASLSNRMNENKGILGTLISDNQSATDLKAIISNIKNGSKQLVNLSFDLEKFLRNMDSNNSVAGILLNDTSSARQFKQTISNLKSSSEYSKSITKQINQSIQQTDNNTLGMLMKDSAFATDIRQSISNLKLGTEKLNTTLDALQHSKLLRSYFIEINKIDKSQKEP